MLKVLPANVYNLIAAGEVVKRPASVVKELMENSVDAGATSITLIITDFGRTLIQVTDNGGGMTKEEAEICFLSHATSKIESVEDLEKLTTFGFRGEALASIAACSDVTLKTRKAGENIGTELHIAASVMEKIEETACPTGCNIAVRNLFYNIPARRKFLKSDSSEYRHILSEFMKVALTRLDIEFKLINNSKEVITLPAGRTLKQRIADSGGIAATKQLIDIHVDTSVVKLHGYISEPGSAKKSQGNQFFFANGRYFRNPAFYRAVIKGYTNLIPEGYSPAYFIFFEVNPQEMDVNISPDKTEVKFENESVIFQILEAAVREAIGKNAFAPMIEFDTEGVPLEIANADGFTMNEKEKSEFRSNPIRPPKINYDPLFNPFEEELKSRHSGAVVKSYESSMNSSADDELFEQPSDFQVLNISKEHIAIASEDGGITIVDVARARTKIFYSRYLSSLLNGKPAIQEELFPISVSLSHSDFNSLMSNVEAIRELGFEIRQFGKDSIVVSGIPANFIGEKFSVEEYITELAHTIGNEDSPLNINEFSTERKERIALSVTRHTNFSSNFALSENDAKQLIGELFAYKDAAICPTGGYTLTTITTKEIKERLL